MTKMANKLASSVRHVKENMDTDQEQQANEPAETKKTAKAANVSTTRKAAAPKKSGTPKPRKAAAKANNEPEIKRIPANRVWPD
jgi:hypothetical protein